MYTITANMKMKVYAIVETITDIHYNEGEKDIIIIESQEELEELEKHFEEEQIYTGRTWKIHYIK